MANTQRDKRMRQLENKILYWTEWRDKEISRAQEVAGKKIADGKDADYWAQWASEREIRSREIAGEKLTPMTAELQQLVDEAASEKE